MLIKRIVQLKIWSHLPLFTLSIALPVSTLVQKGISISADGVIINVDAKSVKPAWMLAV